MYICPLENKLSRFTNRLGNEGSRYTNTYSCLAVHMQIYAVASVSGRSWLVVSTIFSAATLSVPRSVYPHLSLSLSLRATFLPPCESVAKSGNRGWKILSGHLAQRGPFYALDTKMSRRFCRSLPRPGSFASPESEGGLSRKERAIAQRMRSQLNVRPSSPARAARRVHYIIHDELDQRSRRASLRPDCPPCDPYL